MWLYKYKGRIKCAKCGWAMRGKKARSKNIYICAKYNKEGTCERNKIDEEVIDQLVGLRNPQWGHAEVEAISVGEEVRVTFYDGTFVKISNSGLTITR